MQDQTDSHRLSLIRCAIAVVMGVLAVHQILGNYTPDFALDYAAAWAYWNGRPVHSSTAELLAECWPDHRFHELIGGAVASLSVAPLCAGTLLGLAIAVKAYPAVLAIGLVLTRQWRCLTAMLAAAGAATIAAELVFGVGTTAEWLAFTGVVTSVHVDSPENRSLVRHMLQLIAIPGTVAACLLAGILTVPLARKLSKDDPIRPFIPVALLASPLSWRHYMGLTGALNLGRVEQSCLALAGLTVLLFGMKMIGPPQSRPLSLRLSAKHMLP